MKLHHIAPTIFIIAIGVALFFTPLAHKNALQSENTVASIAPNTYPTPLPKSTKIGLKKQMQKAHAPVESDVDKGEKAEEITEALELERLRTLDPALGYVPTERRIKALEQTRRMQAEMVQNASFLRGNLQKSRWIERGPGNVGGRTRTILVDLNDPTHQTLFSAGVTGGLFKMTNSNAANSKWQRIQDWNDVLTVSSLAQDPRNPQIMYLGTGDSDVEGLGSDNGTGFYTAKGNGIYQSKDGGKTWQSLLATVEEFRVVSSIWVTPDSGYVFACTFSGLFKSKDKGETWEKVLSSGLRLGNTNNIFYKIEQGSNGRLYVCNQGNIFKSDVGGDVGTWTKISGSETGFPSGWVQTEIALAPSNPNVLYAVGSVSGKASAIYKTTDGGTTWRTGTRPAWRDGCGASVSNADFTRGQAWYDLNITVAPDDPNTVYVGGVDFFRSVNSGQSWTQMTSWSGNCGTDIKYAHSDHHVAVFDPNNPKLIYLGTDGGVFKIDNPAETNFTVTEKTNGFNTTQFYACAIHPDSGINQFMAGAQDNGTLIVRSSGVGNANGRSIGGDGFLCFIDDNEPLIQIGSIYNGAFQLSTDGGFKFSSGSNANGGFYTPADYDSKNNILYAQTNNGDLWRWKVGQNNGETVDIADITLTNVTHIFSDPSTDKRIYIGNRAGKLYRVDNASTGSTLKDVTLVGSFTGFISCVDVEKTDRKSVV